MIYVFYADRLYEAHPDSTGLLFMDLPDGSYIYLSRTNQWWQHANHSTNRMADIKDVPKTLQTLLLLLL